MRLRSMTHGPIPIWTKRSTSASLAHPITGPINVSNAAKLRMGIQMEDSSADLTMTLGIRCSNDGDTWGSVTALGSLSLANDGSDFETAFAALPGTPLLFAQIVVLARNTSGNPPQLECAKACIRLETRDC